jgi:hypothetical protein
MTVVRVKCIDCDNMILPETAAANGGLCGVCARMSEPSRRALREFAEQLASGALFLPSPDERAAAGRPAVATWRPEPDYYEGRERPVPNLIADAAAEPAGYVFLVSDGGARLGLAFNEVYGVCDYQNPGSGESLYAYTSENLREQVPADRHLVQACPCDGVGLHWYPSRFHIPRPAAFAIFSALAQNTTEDPPVPVEWLGYGDITFTGRGRG